MQKSGIKNTLEYILRFAKPYQSSLPIIGASETFLASAYIKRFYPPLSLVFTFFLLMSAKIMKRKSY